jgi:hypothetical protein
MGDDFPVMPLCPLRWDYLVEPLKVSSLTDQYLLTNLGKAGDDGWELVTILPLPQPDPKGFYDTTVALMILKRPQLP